MLFGVDRFGQLALRDVELSQQGQSAAIWVGTKAAVGVFATSTRLISATGDALPASSLVQGFTITDYSFEAIVGLAHTDREARGERIWQSVLDHAVASDCTDALLPRYRTGALGRISQSDLVGTQPIWSKFVVALDALRREGDDVVFDRGEVGLLQWYLSALTETAVPYSLSFDSIQHSAAISVLVGSAHAPRSLRGACAFQLAFELPMTKLTWIDPLWSPVASGFLIKGSD